MNPPGDGWAVGYPALLKQVYTVAVRSSVGPGVAAGARNGSGEGVLPRVSQAVLRRATPTTARLTSTMGATLRAAATGLFIFEASLGVAEPMVIGVVIPGTGRGRGPMHFCEVVLTSSTRSVVLARVHDLIDDAVDAIPPCQHSRRRMG